MIAMGSLSTGLWVDRAALLRRQESLLLERWGSRGYREVAPPLLLPRGPFPEKDHGLKGRTFALRGEEGLHVRADFTVAVALMVASRRPPAHGVLRLSYAGPVVRRPSPDLKEPWELHQAGLERVAPLAAPSGDGEVLFLAADGLLALGLRDAVLELGHWGVAGPLLGRLPWPEEGRALLAAALNRKSLSNLEALEGRYGSSEESRLLKELLHVGGRPEAVEALAPRLGRAGVLSAWESLRRLGEELSRKFPSLAVRLDPLDVRRWSTYTGLTFKAFTPRHPHAVLAGGRYDGLYPDLGHPLGAVGFAVRLPL